MEISCSSVLNAVLLVLMPLFLCAQESSSGAAASGHKESGTSTGLEVAISSKGLQYLSSVWKTIVKRELAVLELEDITGTYEIPVIKTPIEYNISNFNVTKLELGDSSITSSTKSGLLLTLNDSSLSISADWKYSVGYSWTLLQIPDLFKLSDHGSLVALAEGVWLRMGLLLGANEEGSPHINLTTCFFQVRHFDITFSGPSSPFYNNVVKIFEDTLKQLLNGTVCEKLEQLLNDAMDTLRSQQVVIHVDDIAGVNLTLTKQPVFSENSILTSHKGDICSISQPNLRRHQNSTARPPDWNGSSDRMVSILATEHVLNTAAVVYTRAGQLTQNVTADKVDDKNSFLRLDTTTISLLIPQLFHKYGNQSLMLTIRPKRTPPTVSFTEEGAAIAVTAALDVYVVCNTSRTRLRPQDSSGPQCVEHSMPLAFTLGIDAKVNGKFNLTRKTECNNTLYVMGEAKNMKVNLTLIRSNVGEIDIAKINHVAQGLKLIETKALPMINKWAGEGISIPDLAGLTLDNPQLVFHEGYVTLETDITEVDSPTLA